MGLLFATRTDSEMLRRGGSGVTSEFSTNWDQLQTHLATMINGDYSGSAAPMHGVCYLLQHFHHHHVGLDRIKERSILYMWYILWLLYIVATEAPAGVGPATEGEEGALSSQFERKTSGLQWSNSNLAGPEPGRRRARRARVHGAHVHVSCSRHPAQQGDSSRTRSQRH